MKKTIKSQIESAIPAGSDLIVHDIVLSAKEMKKREDSARTAALDSLLIKVTGKFHLARLVDSHLIELGDKGLYTYIRLFQLSAG